MIELTGSTVKMSGMILHEGDELAPGDPFQTDHYNMGRRLGTNVMVMYDTFPGDRMRYLIIVDTETGKRLVIDFLEKKEQAT